MGGGHQPLFKNPICGLAKRVYKNILFCLFSCVFAIVCSAQPDSLSHLMRNISAETNLNKRIDSYLQLFINTADVNPIADMQIAQLLLIQSRKNGDKIGEALAYSMIGYDYRSFGNSTKSLENLLKGVAVSDEIGNLKLTSITKFNLAHHYKDLGDYSKALGYYKTARENAIALNDHLIQLWVFNNIAQVYQEINKLDSALYYAQRAYELRDLDPIFAPHILRQLATIHSKLQNHELAISYFNLSLKEAGRIKSVRWLNEAHTAMAEYYKEIELRDSSISNAVKAINDVENTPYSMKIIKPAKLLLDIYENTNSDSAIKYFKMYKTVNDSLFSSRSIQQTQLMNLEEEMRQKELAAEKTRKEDERIANTQYAAIAAGLILFIIVFLLLSRSIIVNEKWISFLGILGLLILFEFINLFFHSYIASVTNHSPVLKLVILVIIAALLIPAHHNLEHWVKHKLVEKNKRIRLAAAKRTIEELEK